MNHELNETIEITDELIISIATAGAYLRYRKELELDLKERGFTISERKKIQKELKIEIRRTTDDIAAARFALEQGLSAEDAKKYVATKW